jgi:hypothetical protein
MDALALMLWVLRLAFLAAIYLFLLYVVRALRKDLRRSVQQADRPLGRLVVLASTAGTPVAGAEFPLGAANTIGRDINNSVVLDEEFVSGRHAALTYRGRAWYVEDFGSTNGVVLNGSRIEGAAPLGWGDEVQIGGVRMRLERQRPR